MTPEELRAARIAEARRRAAGIAFDAVRHLADLYETNWTPPVVDPDLLAAREWAATRWPFESRAYRAGHQDDGITIPAYLAGCTRGREGALADFAWPVNRGIGTHAQGWNDAINACKAALASAKRGG
jgi:hypothetical protein